MIAWIFAKRKVLNDIFRLIIIIPVEKGYFF